MDDNLNEEQQRKLAEFDAGVSALLNRPLADQRIMRAVERRLRWRNRVRVFGLPAVAALFAVYLAPALWLVLQQVLPLVPGNWLSLNFEPDALIQALATMPLYVWAVVAGAVLTVVTTLLES